MKFSLVLLLCCLGIALVSAVVGRKLIIKKEYSSSSEEFRKIGRKHNKPNYDMWHSSSEEHGKGNYPKPRPSPSRTSTCAADWMTFNRPQGAWCVKVIYGDANKYTADSLCQAQGAVLTGLQTADERMQVAASARNLNVMHGNGVAEVWIGATRKAYCPASGSCSPNDTFEWTDGHTTGTDGFYFSGSEPNNYGGGCHFTYLLLTYGYGHGSLDDDNCPTAHAMYVCGKRPS